MSVEDFFNLFLLISAIHGFVFCFALYFSRGGRNKVLIFINLLALAISLNNFQSWVVVKDFFRGNVFIQYFQVPWHFWIAPFFYLFLNQYLNVAKKSFNILKIILFTFCAFLVIRFGFYIYSEKINSDVIYFFRKYVVIEEIISSVFSLTIFIYSYKIYKESNTLSNITTYDNLNWIRIFFRLGLLSYVFWFVPLLITLYLGFEVFMPSYYPLRVFTTILIYWLGYQSILQLKILKEREYLRKYNALYVNQKTTSYNQNNIDKKVINIPNDVVDNILRSLEKFEKEKQYSSQNVTLNNLANQLNTNTAYLSKVINHYKELSFNNYINNLRINNITEQLETNSIIRKFTIKAIALEAGYKSADSFSKAFFKLKGVNPSDFIKKMEKLKTD
ncbi:helix-turn-helix domain-containing protein [Tenacibaculum tangerinum]|uniref:Helix-turn-helix domain-containing protein n=1 Tax=Tenacibaculum tangerinum TaxID=3038772 RepID=A0ABY8KZW1_9FLAO|nr:helix-turn-helix domain-containing protein [Tenacibaculum tangerinum]WGH74386.1 helix-turn-helix domain-containing protein [Tenacibaculum tangerinum]